ncbi:hypothetical protein HIM_05065 [Hirsutella minnesotensis 3608]|uniref:Nuc-1 negative regulatory protein preg n=1 Tax=Hirsutella minnesotensis 3608 TaxID=1043627 RepID=A0A0F8A0T5_9HYPO|nr:hypothetical protein HIM_05065 [Hirsutella minnesotensis 3608]
MLKTSPVLVSSANASPTSFRCGHPPAPSSSGSPPSTSSRSRHTASWVGPSPTAPPPRSPCQVRVGATDQADTSPSSSSPRQSSREPPPVPAASALTQANAQPVAPAARVQHTARVPSPVKRRGSPASGGSHPRTARDAPADPSQRPPPEASSKRPKANEPPPKILPQKYELCAAEDMVELIAYMLAELITTNDAIRISSGGLTRFHSRTAPGISVRDYLQRLAKHATLTPPLLLAMVYYIDRLCALYQDFTINTLTVHRFLITAATVAAKGLSDSFWNNTTYARVGGVRVAELKMLELEFLYRVDWKIVPNPEVLVAYYQGLVERTPGYSLESEGPSEDDVDYEDDEDEDDIENPKGPSG